MTSEEIIDRLAERHSKDVFVPECKDGPTQAGPHLRLDAWAMTRSWASYRTFGYEVKISRSDFMRDAKMQFYLPLCHELSIVCPAGVVESLDEMPEGVGLLMASPNYRRLITKKKPAYRDIADPVLIYRYILMARAKIERPYYALSSREDHERFWRGWLERKELDRDLGHRVSRTLRELIRARIEKVEDENAQLKRLNEGFAETRFLLKQLGIESIDGFTWRLREVLEAYKAGFPEELKSALKFARDAATRLAQEVKEAEDALKKYGGLPKETS